MIFNLQNWMSSYDDSVAEQFSQLQRHRYGREKIRTHRTKMTKEISSRRLHSPIHQQTEKLCDCSIIVDDPLILSLRPRIKSNKSHVATTKIRTNALAPNQLQRLIGHGDRMNLTKRLEDGANHSFGFIFGKA